MKGRPFTHALRQAGAGLSLPTGGAGPVLLASACVGLSLLLAAAGECRARGPLEVPLRRIDRAHRNSVRSIVERPTLVRRLPTRAFRADSATYVYLLDNLSLSSRLSDALGHGRYRVKDMGNGRLYGRDFSGVRGYFWLVHSGPGSRIYWGKGSYDAWYIPKISAEILLVVGFRKIGAADTESEPGVMATTVDVYVSTNRFVGYIMEMMGRVTDEKLSQLISSAQRTSEELSSDPREVWGRMTTSGLFTPEELESFRRTFLPAASRRDPTSRRSMSRRSGL